MLAQLRNAVLIQGFVALVVWCGDDPPPGPHSPNLPPLPKAPDIPTPPMPDPLQSVTIYQGEEFVVDDSVKCVVQCFPPGAMKVSHRFVPAGQTWTLTGTFTDGAGVVTGDREFAGPCYVYRCRVAAACDACWLNVVEVGGENPETRLLKCVLGPRPPPGPVPPVPVPVPVPVDPLVATFQAAYAADADPDKAATLAKVIVVMDGLVGRLKATGSVTSLKQLQDSVAASTQAQVGTGKLPKLGAAVAAHVAGKLGTSNQAMTDALWAAAAAEYAKVVGALKGVKP